MKLTEMPEIDAAIAAESWEWIQDAVPPLAAGIKAEVKRGTTPAVIRRHVWQQTQRAALALRCEQAARHLAIEAREA